MKSEKFKTSKPHLLILKLTYKSDLRRGEKNVALSNVSIYYTWENIKSSYKNHEFKISAPADKMINFKYLMDHILYKIFKIISSILKKKKYIDNPSIRIYVNKIESRITFKIKTGYYLELFTPETM